ncbi:MAG: hypothetical protein HMLKMBBP_02863 [Planctomycetes bacterium]|nr:hypothetical protein [Planctomycetota bacterium]
MRALRACSSARLRSSLDTPSILMSICSAVMPRWVPATLKSMSPQASSLPAMSVRMTSFFPSSLTTRPMAMPATGWLIFTPASMSARVPPHTVAIDDEPFDSRISDTIRIVYGNSSWGGRIASIARSPSFPWPISRREGPRMGFVSPTEKLGKL